MKVALVLTGLSRCWEQAYPSFKSNFIDPFSPDIFINIWSEKGYYSGKSYMQGPSDEYIKLAPNDKGFHPSGELADVNAIISTYNPVAIQVKTFSPAIESIFEKKVETFVNAYTRPKNTAAQAYMAWEGIQMAVNYSSYDMIIRARPDIVLEQPCPPLLPNVIYTLPSKNKLGRGTGDSIQIGNQEQMFQFAQMWNNLGILYERCGVSCPHMFVEEWIKMLQIPWQEIRINAHVAHSPKGLYQEPD